MPPAGMSVRRVDPPVDGPELDTPRQQVPRRAPAPERVPGTPIAERRTITIQGRGAERYRGTPQRRRPAQRAHERAGFKPDRTAMWAVMLGVLMILAAATSSHAATLRASASHVAAAPAQISRHTHAGSRGHHVAQFKLHARAAH